MFASDGPPAASPFRLAVVLILQFAEGLTDRQAAEAVRTRIDWKYVLCLELTDPGFDYSILSEFRARIVAGGAEQQLLDQLLTLFPQQGLLKTKGQQRTDSTPVLGAARAMNRLECVSETFRHARNTLAVVAPEWRLQPSQPEWVDRYARRAEDARLPSSQTGREEYAEVVGADGLRLWRALQADASAEWLRHIPAGETLRQVWVQNSTGKDEDHLRWRSSDDSPPSSVFVSSPYDTDAHYSQKRSTSWVGYQVHVTETCEPDQPRIITHVETTSATVADGAMTPVIHRALQDKALLPETHIVDTGYLDAELLVSSQQAFQVDLVGPTRDDYRWQAQQARGFAAEDFAMDWERHQAICPAGCTRSSWTPAVDKRTNAVIKIKFSETDCGRCAFQTPCTTSSRPRRSVTIRPQEQYQALQAARAREKTKEFAQLYARRAGIEATISQGVRAFGLRRARYIGASKTHLQHILIAAAINLARIVNWLDGEVPTHTRQSAFVRLLQPAT